MGLECNSRAVAGAMVLDVTGRVTLGNHSDDLRTAILSLAASGHQRLVVNLAGVEHMDSAGLGELVSSHSKIRKAGGAMRLLNPPPRIQELLRITYLDQVFEIFTDETAALHFD